MKIKSEKIKILSAEFENMSRVRLCKLLRDRLAKNERTVIFTPNPQILLRASSSRELTDLLKSSDLNIPDGIGIIIASRILGHPLRQRISGIDLAEDVLNIANEKGYSVFLLGGKTGNAHRAERALKLRYPKLRICGCHNGYFSKQGEENRRVVEQISRTAPQILFVCFGFPAQEEWIKDNLPFLPTVALAMGLGGSIDVWSGRIRRSPKLLRELGLEWLWRAMLQPKRAGIFIDIPRFLLRVEKQKRRLNQAP